MKIKLFIILLAVIIFIFTSGCISLKLSNKSILSGNVTKELFDSIVKTQNKLSVQKAEDILSRSLTITFIGSTEDEIIQDIKVNNGYIILFDDSISRYWSEKIVDTREHFANMTVEDFHVINHVTRIPYNEVEHIRMFKGKRSDRFDFITKRNYRDGYFGNIYSYEKLNNDSIDNVAVISSLLFLFKNLKD